MPDIFFHEQFAKTQEQWKVLAGLRNKLSKARGKGKGQAGKNKGIGGLWWNFETAIGASRVLQPPQWEGRPWSMRQAMVITLPGLFFELSEKYTACQLYRFWQEGELLAVKRQHAWGNPERQAAAKLRYEDTGHYGFKSRVPGGR